MAEIDDDLEIFEIQSSPSALKEFTETLLYQDLLGQLRFYRMAAIDDVDNADLEDSKGRCEALRAQGRSQICKYLIELLKSWKELEE